MCLFLWKLLFIFSSPLKSTKTEPQQQNARLLLPDGVGGREREDRKSQHKIIYFVYMLSPLNKRINNVLNIFIWMSSGIYKKYYPIKNTAIILKTLTRFFMIHYKSVTLYLKRLLFIGNLFRGHHVRTTPFESCFNTKENILPELKSLLVCPLIRLSVPAVRDLL